MEIEPVNNFVAISGGNEPKVHLALGGATLDVTSPLNRLAFRRSLAFRLVFNMHFQSISDC